MKTMNWKWLIPGCLLALLVACGGSGGGGGSFASELPGGGIGGTGVSSSGTISAFGSIFVNGVEFETDEATVSIDGDDSTETALGLGMVVLVQGTVNDDGVTGTATTVIYDDDLQGPVEAILISDDGDSKTLTILGFSVIVGRASTVFDDVSFDTLVVGDLVEVSGFFDASGALRATRIEKKSTFVSDSSEIELKGTVENLSGNTFSLGSFTVDFSAADLTDVPGGEILDGMRVEVRGTLVNTLISAGRVEQEDDLDDSFGDDDDVSVEGIVTDFVSNADFMINRVPVDASNAIFLPAGLVLENGVRVEAEGTWNGTVLIADEVGSRQGDVKIDALVDSVDTVAETVTLQLFGGTVTVQVNNRTQLKDDTGLLDTLTLGDLFSGDFVEVEAVASEAELIATSIRRDEADDDIVQAPVESFESGVSVTVLGITYLTAGADFEDVNDLPITSTAFYSQVQVGNLVKIKDDLTTDGIADEVEFEN
jgi:hypothetical protein